MQKGSLYSHIESKADLLWEVAREGAEAFHAALDAVPEDGPVVERIRAALRAPPARRRRAARRRHRLRPGVALPRGRAPRGVRRRAAPLRGALPRRSSARAASSASCAPISTTAPPRCSRSRRELGLHVAAARRATPTSSPTASRRCCSTACAATRRADAAAASRAHRHPRCVHAVLIVNPFATRVTDAAARGGRARARAASRELDGRQTEHRAARDRARRGACRDGCEAIFVFSGDGGFNEALNGLEADVPIGFLPGGGTSVLPRALGLPRDPVAAAASVAEAIEQGRTRRITRRPRQRAPLRLQRGLGLDAEAVRRVDELGRRADGKRPGDLAFALAVVRTLAAAARSRRAGARGEGPRPRGVRRSSRTASRTRTRSGSPLPIAPEARLRARPRRRRAGPHPAPRRSLRTAYAVLRGHARERDVLYAHDVDRIEIVCDQPMPLQVDGEDLGDVESAVFEAERGRRPGPRPERLPR